MKLGWIDFSEKDRKRALEVIQNLTERGAVDEIGIGVVRDAFSDYFFLERLQSRPEPSISC